MGHKMRKYEEIQGFHAHVYYGTKCGWFTKPSPERRKTAASLQDFFIMYEAKNAGSIVVGRMHDEPTGPHTQPMFLIEIGLIAFAEVFKLLVLNHQDLSILIHPITSDVVEDHTNLATWLGEKLPIDLDKL